MLGLNFIGKQIAYIHISLILEEKYSNKVLRLGKLMKEYLSKESVIIEEKAIKWKNATYQCFAFHKDFVFI